MAARSYTKLSVYCGCVYVTSANALITQLISLQNANL